MSDRVRLNKHLAHTLGVSRRQADELIESQRVRVNSLVARIGQVVDPQRDKIAVNDTHLASGQGRYLYVLLNKPVGYVSSRRKQGDTPTLYDLLPRHMQALKIAGRLDKDSCGLILLTNDGDMIYRLTHPSVGKKKTYLVGLNKPLTETELRHLAKGVRLEDGTLSLLDVQPRSTPRPNYYKVTMTEGRNRQIRRTFGAIGYTVMHLERTQLGPYRLSDLQDKQYLQIAA